MLIRIFYIFLLCVIYSPASATDQAELKKYSIKIIKEGLYSSNEDVRLESLILMGKDKVVDSTVKKKNC